MLTSDGAAHDTVGRWFDLHVDAIYGYAARRLGEHTALDVVSETFRVAYERFADFDPERGEPRAWLYGIATNLIRRHWRTEARRMRAHAAAAALVAGERSATSDDVDGSLDARSRPAPSGARRAGSGGDSRRSTRWRGHRRDGRAHRCVPPRRAVRGRRRGGLAERGPRPSAVPPPELGDQRCPGHRRGGDRCGGLDRFATGSRDPGTSEWAVARRPGRHRLRRPRRPPAPRRPSRCRATCPMQAPQRPSSTGRCHRGSRGEAVTGGWSMPGTR